MTVCLNTKTLAVYNRRLDRQGTQEVEVAGGLSLDRQVNALAYQAIAD